MGGIPSVQGKPGPRTRSHPARRALKQARQFASRPRLVGLQSTCQKQVAGLPDERQVTRECQGAHWHG